MLKIQGRIWSFFLRLGCYDKNSVDWEAYEEQKFFLIVLETGKMKVLEDEGSRCLVNTPFLVHTWCLFSVLK